MAKFYILFSIIFLILGIILTYSERKVEEAIKNNKDKIDDALNSTKLNDKQKTILKNSLNRDKRCILASYGSSILLFVAAISEHLN